MIFVNLFYLLFFFHKFHHINCGRLTVDVINTVEECQLNFLKEQNLLFDTKNNSFENIINFVFYKLIIITETTLRKIEKYFINMRNSLFYNLVN